MQIDSLPVLTLAEGQGRAPVAGGGVADEPAVPLGLLEELLAGLLRLHRAPSADERQQASLNLELLLRHHLPPDDPRGTVLARCLQDHLQPYPVAVAYAPPASAVTSFDRLRELGITRRECEVLQRIALGRKDAEIAAELALSPRTVNKHVENLLRKMRAPNRSAAAHLAREFLRWL
jgi:DNA-binding CsgD family transcriptional regulator